MTIPNNATVNTSKEDHVVYHNDLADAANNALPAATTFTTTTMPNPIAGGNMTVVVFPEDTVVMAIALEGDAFPRFFMPADATDAILYLGDGTTDPFYGNAYMGISSGKLQTDYLKVGQLSASLFSTVSMPDGWSVESDSFVGSDDSIGIVLTSANSTKYRITVQNDGSLSTTVVP